MLHYQSVVGTYIRLGIVTARHVSCHSVANQLSSSVQEIFIFIRRLARFDEYVSGLSQIGGLHF